ncbi:DUF1688 family protein [Polycladidibacter hongkongensis]|uniref:DUF1688 family protein n=1 Tax=Polycladidibacter hongkongensis TaxID=1647556 RepID=UPI000830A986|nr:DUF1688 family protein [Pseudovibrio hongkongensis]
MIDSAGQSVKPSAAIHLLSLGAIMQRCQAVFELVSGDTIDGLQIDSTALDPLAAMVERQLVEANEAGAILPYTPWRLLEAGGVDRWGILAGARRFADLQDMQRAAADVATLIALLGGSPGEGWRYLDPVTGETLSGREGLAAAILNMFASGAFSEDPADPLRADAAILFAMETDELREGLQGTANNVVVGLEARAALLRRIGEALTLRSDLFEKESAVRPGNLLANLQLEDTPLTAARIFDALQDGLGAIWQRRPEHTGVVLGDCWPLAALAPVDQDASLVPIHAAMLWATSAIIEVLAWSGAQTLEFDDLGAVADINLVKALSRAGVLRFSPSSQPLPIDADVVIAARAAAHSLLAHIAQKIRRSTGTSAEELPLTCVAFGLYLAVQGENYCKSSDLRADFPKISSDGTTI